jgi:excisionase family DNA binding protein
MSDDLAEEISFIFERARQEAVSLILQKGETKVDAPPLLTARDVAARLQTNTQTIYRLAREGKLPTVPISTRTRRWTEDAVEAFITGQTDPLATN